MPSTRIVAITLAWMFSVDAHAAIMGVDFNFAGSPTYFGDDGVLSPSGGIVWNGVQPAGSARDLLDAFGEPTPFDYLPVPSPDFTQFAGLNGMNTLQDTGFGTSSLASVEFKIAGLTEATPYDLAVYLGDDGPFTATTITVQHAAGTSVLTQRAGGTYELPGAAGRDYLLFAGIAPGELGTGEYGFDVFIDGVGFGASGIVTGFQISGIPSPGTAVILLGSLSGLGVGRARNRRLD